MTSSWQFVGSYSATKIYDIWTTYMWRCFTDCRLSQFITRICVSDYILNWNDRCVQRKLAYILVSERWKPVNFVFVSNRLWRELKPYVWVCPLYAALSFCCWCVMCLRDGAFLQILDVLYSTVIGQMPCTWCTIFLSRFQGFCEISDANIFLLILMQWTENC